MELVPYYDQEKLSIERVIVRINPADRKRIWDLVMRARGIPDQIQDKEDYDKAHQMARELKAGLTEINASKRQAKIPFEAVINSIEELAKDLSVDVNQENTRILSMMGAYVQHLEELNKAAERKRKEEERIAREEAERKIAEAEAKAKAAKDDLEREKAVNEALRVRLEQQLEGEVGTLNHEPPKGLVPHGRVDHRWKFKLIDPVMTVLAGRVRLLRIELDRLACQDLVKEQLANGKEPDLPGIEVSKQVSVSVKPSTRIA